MYIKLPHRRYVTRVKRFINIKTSLIWACLLYLLNPCKMKCLQVQQCQQIIITGRRGAEFFCSNVTVTAACQYFMSLATTTNHPNLQVKESIPSSNVHLQWSHCLHAFEYCIRDHDAICVPQVTFLSVLYLNQTMEKIAASLNGCVFHKLGKKQNIVLHHVYVGDPKYLQLKRIIFFSYSCYFFSLSVPEAVYKIYLLAAALSNLAEQ